MYAIRSYYADALETMLGLLENNPEADFAYGRHDRFEVLPGGDVKWQDTGYWRESSSEDFLFDTLLDMFAHQPAMLVRKSLYIKAGAFDETLIRSQDYDMLLRLARYGRVITSYSIHYTKLYELFSPEPSSLRGSESAAA